MAKYIVANPKDKVRLHSDHLQKGHQKLGPQTSKLVPCEKSEHHPHHPEREACGWCVPYEYDEYSEETIPWLYRYHR